MADLRPFYHRFAWAYDLLIPKAAGPTPDSIVRLFAERGVTRGSTVVDAGCGTGAYSRVLSAAGLDVVGLEQSAELLTEARAKAESEGAGITFVEADLLAWRPDDAVDGVLCRGVLNDITGDDERRRAFELFAAWLRPRGVLLADVRDWESSRRRYLDHPTSESTLETDRGTLTFRSSVQVHDATLTLLFEERFMGVIDGESVDDPYSFPMRCWTRGELRDRARRAGFDDLGFLSNEADGRKADRLVIAATAAG